MRVSLLSFVGICLIFASFTAVQADETQAVLSGHIYSIPPLLPAIIPLPGADVHLSGNGITLHTTSNSEGLYEFSNVAPGMYILAANAPGHLPGNFIDSIFVVSGQVLNDLDIYLTPYDDQGFVSLSGQVWEKETDTAIHPAYITIFPLTRILTFAPIPDDSMRVTVTNNPDGSYKIEKIPRGVYNVRCTARGYDAQIIRNVDLTMGDVTLDFYLLRLDPSLTNLLAGIVSNERSNIPICGAKLSLINLDGLEMLYRSCSDREGYYQFSHIYPGNYAMEVIAPGFQVLRDTLEIRQETWITDFNIYLKAIMNDILVTLYGSVWEIGVDDKPVYPAQIILFGYTSNGNSIVYRTQNNPDGTYKIDNILPGIYLVICSAPGYHTKIIDHLVLYQTEHYLNFYLSPIIQKVGYLAGKVYFDHLGTPVMGAEIKFFSENAVQHHTFTDKQGHYLARIPVGEYYVSCSYRGADGNYYYQEYYDDAHSLGEADLVPVKANSVTSGIDFGIPYPQPSFTVIISGTVTDNENMPLGKALVKVWQINVPTYSVLERQFYYAWTDDQGRYKISIDLNQFTLTSGPLPLYGFIVSAEKEGYKIEFYNEKPAPYLADVLYAYSGTIFSDINFTLDSVAAPNSISGTISDELGQGIANGFVIAVDARNGEIVFAYTNQLGQYTLSALKLHYYYLLFTAPGYMPEFFDNVQQWENATPVLANGTVTGIDASLTAIYWDSAPGIVAGKVCNSQGQPLSGALVAIKNDHGIVVGYDLSDDNGGYEIKGLGNGDYQVFVTKVNFASKASWINSNLSESEMVILDFELKQMTTDLPDLSGQDRSIPSQIQLMPNYPNPFNPVTNIQFANPSMQEVRLVIYDILGKKVKELVHDTLPAGWYIFQWNARDEQGRQVSSGVYFYALETSEQRIVSKLIFSK